MSKDWEYAKVTKWIAEHGGPQKALRILEDYYMKKGFKKGASSKNPLIVLSGAMGIIVGTAGKCIYDKIREKKTIKVKDELAEQAEVKKAEIELVNAIKQGIKYETEKNDGVGKNLESTDESTKI